MAVRIEETFRVDAPVERVWRFLLDPHQVVQCLPGAELIEAQDERTFLGRVRVKVGPISASYKGRAELTEVDEQNHRVRMTGEGQDTKGAGSARMTMTSRITAGDDGAAEVSVESEIQLVGKLAQFGRGMVEEVSKQLFRQFTECARQRLEAEGGAAVEGDAQAAVPASPDASPGASPTPGAAGTAPDASVSPVSGSAGAGATAAETSHPSAAASAAAMTSSPATTTAPAAKPVSILPLLFRALRARIARLFGRTKA